MLSGASDRAIAAAVESGLERFQELVSNLRLLLNESAAPLFSGDPVPVVQLAVQGITFELIPLHLPERDDSFVLQCGFGRPADEEREAALRGALLVNHGLACNGTGMFALNGDEVLVFSVLQSIATQDPQVLLQGMQQIAALAHEWRALHVAPVH